MRELRRRANAISTLTVTVTLLATMTRSAPVSADVASERESYVQQVVSAVSTASRRELLELETALRRGARSQCRSSFGNPAVRCLLKTAQSTCRSLRSEVAGQSACRRIADLIITNQLAEDEWIDKSTRVRLMNSADDFRVAINRELARRYAPLAAEMSLSPGFQSDGATLGAKIDRFCVRYTAKRRLTWQRCVAALAWYVGTTTRSNPR